MKDICYSWLTDDQVTFAYQHYLLFLGSLINRNKGNLHVEMLKVQ